MAALKTSRLPDLLMGLAILMLLAVMIVPVPPVFLDVLLVFSIAVSLVMILVTVYVSEPIRFNVFPTLLLVVTLYRLALNVATTRTILLEGYGGKVIAAFGDFVVGGNYAVGLVAFLILVVIQFVVITKGAGRIAEVAARFTLDAMPGRQMAIDADLNAGLIDEEEAKRRRKEVQRQADFYGAMDGAAKFVRGDAIAAIFIIIINILGGFAIGVLQRGMGLGEALRTYTLLTIGDGLVTQIPALIVSTASGILVTRSESQSSLSREIGSQLLGEPRAALLAGGILMLLGFVPGLPFVPFLLLGVLSAGLGLRAGRRQQKVAHEEEEARRKKTTGPEKVESLLAVDTLELEIGFGLVSLVDEDRLGGDLLRRVTLVRKQAASELGLLVPPIRVRDNLRLPQDNYVIRLRGVEIARGQVDVGGLLAMSPGPNALPLDGRETTEPVFGLKASWIRPEQRGDAEMSGYTVVEPSAVVATHLAETIRAHAGAILGRQEVRAILDQVKQTAPVVVEELVPNQLTVGGVQKVMQRLLDERVPIRDSVTILETLADHAPITKDLDTLVERVREALGRAITSQYRDERGQLGVVSLEPTLEQDLVRRVHDTEGSPRLVVPPAEARPLLDSISHAVQRALGQTPQPVLLCSPYLRPYLRTFVARALPHVPVLSYAEVAHSGSVRTLSTVTVEHAHQTI